jgi:hypothetical protein
MTPDSTGEAAMKTTIAAILAWTLVLAAWIGAQTPDPPDCELRTTAAATIWLVSVFAHEDPANPGHRYIHTTDKLTIEPGEVARTCYQTGRQPAPCEGWPIGFEWHWEIPEFSKASALVKTCGETGRIFPPIFSDGFETGNTSRWTRTVPQP